MLVSTCCHGDELMTGFCSRCKEHAEFVNLCEHCGDESVENICESCMMKLFVEHKL